MKTYVEIIENIIRRTNEYQATQKKKRRIIISTATSFCCICLVVLMGFGIWNSGILSNTANDEEIAYPDTEISGESNLPNNDTPPKVDTEPVEEPDDLPVITPPSDDKPNDEISTSGNTKISVAVADDYVAFVNLQKQLRLYDLKNGKIIETNKSANSVTSAGKYIFYRTDDGVYEYFTNQRVCDTNYTNEAHCGNNVLFVSGNRNYFIWNGSTTITTGKIEEQNASCYEYSLIGDTVYVKCHDFSDDGYYIISVTNGEQSKQKADDYAIVGNDVYLLKNGDVYCGDKLVINDGNIQSIFATDFGIYGLKSIDDTHLILTCYDLNGNVTDTIENVSNVKEYDKTIGVKGSVDNQSYAVTITQDGIKQYAVDSLFLEVKCNEKCLVAPGINSFDIVVFENGKQLTIDG